MRILLIVLVVFLTLSAVFGFDPGPAPGVKIKNAILYLLVLALTFRLTMDRSFRVQLPAMPVLFGTQIAYALLTYVAIVLVLDYWNYDALRNGFNLKNSLVDQALFFLVFFYGLRSNADALTVLKILLISWALSHAFAVLDALGLVQIGDIEMRHDGRVQGAVGESNQYGAFVALSLPATLSLMLVTRGIWRLFWLCAAVLTAVTLLMTVSRGAFVATVVAAFAGLYLFRRYVPLGRLAAWGVGSVVILLVILGAAVALGFGELLYQRVIAGSSGDLGGVSSGRSEFWMTALEVMFETPISLITGFGWAAYGSMPFRFAAHNHYLSSWFNLGLPGLACSVLLFIVPIRAARAALSAAAPDVKPVLMGFIVGTIAVAVAVFFVELHSPWQYFWSYAGIVMRLAVNATQGAVAQPTAAAANVREAPGIHQDPHGWTVASSR